MDNLSTVLPSSIHIVDLFLVLFRQCFLEGSSVLRFDLFSKVYFPRLAFYLRDWNTPAVIQLRHFTIFCRDMDLLPGFCESDFSFGFNDILMPLESHMGLQACFHSFYDMFCQMIFCKHGLDICNFAFSSPDIKVNASYLGLSDGTPVNIESCFNPVCTLNLHLGLLSLRTFQIRMHTLFYRFQLIRYLLVDFFDIGNLDILIPLRSLLCKVHIGLYPRLEIHTSAKVKLQ